MTQFEIVYSRAALMQIDSAYLWGVEFWGVEQAESWLDDLESTIESRLATQPRSCPIAPESDRVKRELRHLIHGRYRVIFEIRAKTMRVLRLSGPFNSTSQKPFPAT